MKVYIVRKIEDDKGMSVCMSYDAADMEVDRFYLYLDIECYISIETY